MVRSVIAGPPAAWKAGLAIFIAAGAILWHVLACTESPMAFSPGGENLAFVTMEPYGNSELHLQGAHTYRLFVLTGDQLRVLEETANEVLTAPTYSPDGKHLAYVRLPLWTPKSIEDYKAAHEKRAAVWKQLSDMPEAVPEGVGKATTSDSMLPPLESFNHVMECEMQYPQVPATLVVRQAQSGQVTATVPLELPLGKIWDDPGLLVLYTTLRPQYARDGKTVYLGAGNVLYAVDTAEGKAHTAGLGNGAVMSPDGAAVAVTLTDCLGFLRTDGEAAHYVRIKAEDASPSGLAWSDASTLGLLATRAEEDNVTAARILWFRSDGTALKPQELALPPVKIQRDVPPQFTVSPNGKYMVISFGRSVIFMTSKGSVLRHWEGESELLAQPTFSPDSKRVAMKRLTKEPSRTSAIVFFSPEGKEEAVVEIPPAGATTPTPVPQPEDAAR